ncbi:MAG TPA: DUF4198 domain-containing protein [Sphingomonas sp.]|nr:DUF4198 domain-containing protein [Sphingomonas sp.]
MKKLLIAALALGTATVAQAHEVWIERGANGAAQIWLGEPELPIPAGGDPAFPSLKAPKLIGATAAQTRGAGYIEVALPPGDVRAWDDDVFKPWDEDGKKAGVVYYARAGRSEAKAVMPLELAPLAANGNRFALTRDGKPVAETEVTLVSPGRWMLALKTDASGQVALPALPEKGRYILKASVKEEGDFTLPAGKVAILHRTTTTSFVN